MTLPLRQLDQAYPLNKGMLWRVSYNGNTSAFQADTRSSILLTRSIFSLRKN